MHKKHRIWGAVLALLMLWQLPSGVLAAEAGTAVPFSWRPLEIEGTEHRIVCYTGDIYGVEDDAMPMALALADSEETPAETVDVPVGRSYEESELVTPVRAYDGPIVTFITAAKKSFLTVPAVEIPEDADEETQVETPLSMADTFSTYGVYPTLAVSETPDALKADTLRELSQQGLDLLDGGVAALVEAADENALLQALADGRERFAEDGLRPRGFLYPAGVELTEQQVGLYYANAVRLVEPAGVMQPYNEAERERLSLKALPLTKQTKAAVLEALQETVAGQGWLILYVDPDILTVEELSAVLDTVNGDGNIACLPFSQALTARCGGVLEKDSIALFDEDQTPEGLAIGGLIATNYNADYVTEQGTRFTLFSEDGMVRLALNSVLAEDLEVMPLEDVTPELVVDKAITENTLTYTLGAENYRWVINTSTNSENALTGIPISAGYELVGPGKWSGTATVTLTITNTTGVPKVLTLTASAGSEDITLDTDAITIEDIPENLTYNSTTGELTVLAGANNTILTITIAGDKISGSYGMPEEGETGAAAVTISLTMPDSEQSTGE